MLQGRQMRICQIGHMDEITDGGTVRRRVVCTHYLQRRTPTQNCVEHQWNKMRLNNPTLTNLAIWIRTSSIKVA
jgi:hypothetical protein